MAVGRRIAVPSYQQNDTPAYCTSEMEKPAKNVPKEFAGGSEPQLVVSKRYCKQMARYNKGIVAKYRLSVTKKTKGQSP